jgi:alpha-tubulin suppressor-like RCC1 family protein
MPRTTRIIALALASALAACTPVATPLGHRSLPALLAPLGRVPRVVQLAAGAHHTCALRSDGRVACWGSNEYGQVDTSGPRTFWTPALVPGIDGAMQIAAASGATCARRRNGSVRCWGQIVRDRMLTPYSDIAGLAGATDLAVGFAQVCAVVDEGRVACKDLGDDTPSSRVSLPAPALQIAVGWRHACALARDGHVYCWGSNRSSELAAYDLDRSDTPVEVAGVADAVQIVASLRRTCAWEDDGMVACWGEFEGHEIEDPLRLPDAEGLAGLAATRRRACGWFADGAVRCIERGDGPLPKLERVPRLEHVTQVVAGLEHFCALEEDGAVACWGALRDGELGDPRIARAAPTFVPDLEDATDLVAGAAYVCAARSSGGAKCWGELPYEPAARACALGPDRRVRCSGENDLGQLGDGTTEPHAGPVLVAGVFDATSLATDGTASTCAVVAGGGVTCWGGFAPAKQDEQPSLAPTRAPDVYGIDWSCGSLLLSGPLGGERAPRGPQAVLGVAGAVGIVAGNGGYCVARRDGTVACWSDDRPAHAIEGVSAARGLAGSRDHVCALLEGGGAACWGDDDDAQLGDGAFTRRSESARMVRGLPPIDQLALGHAFTCARTHGRVACWGIDLDGQLGDEGFPYEVRTPSRVRVPSEP